MKDRDDEDFHHAWCLPDDVAREGECACFNGEPVQVRLPLAIAPPEFVSFHEKETADPPRAVASHWSDGIRGRLWRAAIDAAARLARSFRDRPAPSDPTEYPIVIADAIEGLNGKV